MITTPESTSREAFHQYLRGKLIAASNGWKNLLVRIYSEPRVEESVIYPAVAEPRMVRILSGAAAVEERESGGPWLKTLVQADDFFLTASQSPYEVRWRAIGPEPFKTMHLYLGLPVFNRAIEEAFQTDPGATRLRDLSGFKDNFLSALLEGETRKKRGLSQLRIGCLLRPWLPRRQRRAPFLVQNMVSTWRRRQVPR